MNKIAHFLDTILKYTLIFLLSLMVLDVSWQVFSRFVLHSPSSFTEELANFLLIWIGLLGASYAVRTKAHLGIDYIIMHLGGKKKTVLQIIGHMCVFGFAFFVMFIGGIKLMLLTLELNQTSAAMGIRMGLVYFVIPLSGFLIMFYSVFFIRESYGFLINNNSDR
ncbi:TRAP transporter small permease [candidate division KSB1 bacterium]